MPERTQIWPLILMLVPQFFLKFGLPCVPSWCTLSSKFSSCFFSYPPFLISMPTYKLGPGKLDYHGNGIFQIPSSYSRFGAEQRSYHLQVGQLSDNRAQWIVRPGMLCIKDSRLALYIIVSLETINSAWKQGTGMPEAVKNRMKSNDWHRHRTIYERRQWILSWITAHSLLSRSLDVRVSPSLPIPSLKPNCCTHP